MRGHALTLTHSLTLLPRGVDEHVVQKPSLGRKDAGVERRPPRAEGVSIIRYELLQVLQQRGARQADDAARVVQAGHLHKKGSVVEASGGWRRSVGGRRVEPAAATLCTQREMGPRCAHLPALQASLTRWRSSGAPLLMPSAANSLRARSPLLPTRPGGAGSRSATVWRSDSSRRELHCNSCVHCRPPPLRALNPTQL